MVSKAIIKRYPRYYRPRVKWSKQLKNITNRSFTAPVNSEFFFNYDLIENPPSLQSNVSSPKYFKRVKLSFEIEGPNISFIEGLTAHIVYVPEDLNLFPSVIDKHPEWVLGSKFYGSVRSTDESTKVFTLYSKLCKKLLPGDKIAVFFTGENTSTSTSFSVRFNFFIEYYTR